MRLLVFFLYFSSFVSKMTIDHFFCVDLIVLVMVVFGDGTVACL